MKCGCLAVIVTIRHLPHIKHVVAPNGAVRSPRMFYTAPVASGAEADINVCAHWFLVSQPRA